MKQIDYFCFIIIWIRLNTDSPSEPDGYPFLIIPPNFILYHILRCFNNNRGGEIHMSLAPSVIYLSPIF